jgi:hypothetical protein
MQTAAAKRRKNLLKDLVETEILGRPLLQDEEVLFRDGDKNNLTVENVIVLPRPSRRNLAACSACKLSYTTTYQRASGMCGNCWKQLHAFMAQGIYECPNCGLLQGGLRRTIPSPLGNDPTSRSRPVLLPRVPPGRSLSVGIDCGP